MSISGQNIKRVSSTYPLNTPDLSKRISTMKEISLNELPAYSHWVKRILSMEEFKTKHKTREQVLREFNDEKWGGLLADSESGNKFSLEEMDAKEERFDEILPAYFSNSFYLCSGREILNAHLDLYEDILKPHIANASALVELGAGYGSKILNLSKRKGFSELPLYAAEYTPKGCELIKRLGKSISKEIKIGHCDFRDLKLEAINIPENAVIFTSYSVHYVPQLRDQFIGYISKLRPKMVVHFEPCYEHHSLSHLHGLMCRKYIELNDYNRNLITVLQNGKTRGEISIKVIKNMIGGTPFLPISVIEWHPDYQ